MIERIKEVDKLKKIIFDKEQQILFNFCPKPILKLNEENTILTRAQLQSKVRSMSMSQQFQEKQRQQQSQVKTVFKSQQLLKNTIQAVNQFKKGIQKNQFIEMNVYKYLYEAYDTIIEQDPKLQKRKNKCLFNQLGEEMRDIFRTSKLIKTEVKSPIKRGIKPLATFVEIKHPQQEIQEQNQDLESEENINLEQQNQIQSIKRKIKRQQTFKECHLQDSLEDIEKEEQKNKNKIPEDEEDQDEEKSECEQQNEKQLIYFSSGTLSNYSTDGKNTKNQNDQIDNLFAKKMQLQKQNNTNNDIIDHAQILVTEEPQIQTQLSEVSFSQNNGNFLQDQNIQTIFSPKQDEDHPFQRNSQQGNIFNVESAYFQGETK